jgi:hypothetical protein
MKKSILIVLTLMFMFGCAAQPMRTARLEMMSSKPSEAPTSPLLDSYSGDRMVAMTVDINMKTTSADTTRDELIAIAFKYKGYVLNSEQGAVSIRIPSIEFGSAMTEIEKLGKIVQKDINGRDVTDEYTDLQTRLDNAEKTRQRYLTLLDRAAGMQEILMLEKELERLSLIIESYKGKIEQMKHSVEYCTINVKTMPDINPTRPGPVGYAFYYLYKGVKWLFIWD